MRNADDPTNNRGLRCIGPFDGLGFLLCHLPAIRLETGGSVLLLRLYSSVDFGVVIKWFLIFGVGFCILALPKIIMVGMDNTNHVKGIRTVCIDGVAYLQSDRYKYRHHLTVKHDKTGKVEECK